MKIRLIEPKAPGLNVFDRARLPRLGLPLLGQLLAEDGHDVRIYVETLTPVDWDDVGEADLVGLSTTTATAPAAYRIARWASDLGIPTVIGGPHVTFLPDEALAHCDFVVRGEGQRTLPELVAVLQAGTGYAPIAGLSYHDATGQPVHNPDRPPSTPQEFIALPSPGLHLIVGHERMTNIPIMTQWGCPYNCDFCAVIQMFGRRVRARAVEDVLEELEQYRGRGSVFFYDDNFVVDKGRTRALLQGMIARGLTPPWSAQVRADVVYKDRQGEELDHELLGLMRDAGCTMVYCGFESVNPATLAAYNKRQEVRDIRESVRAFHAYGIHVHGMFVLGADTDNLTTFQRTVDFALRNEIDTVQFLMLTPCPGTPFYERIVEQERLLTDDWNLYDGHHCVIRPALMSPYELQVGTIRAMARFYSARRAVWMIVANTTRNLPFLLSLLWRERPLRVQLPRIAALSLLPSRWPNVLDILKGAVGRESWRRLRDMVMVPTLRLYGWRHIREWTRQARSRAYLEFLRRLGRTRQQAATGAS
ncbi:MAG TPA: radical SAM protein [Anaerolineales bacterium]|nr:radical SAM protein [Anaerolineae bacterium]HIQ02008.1 radical SAM protein [Anaerolineales bacterium]